MNIDSLSHENQTQAINVNTQDMNVNRVKKNNTIESSASPLNKETKFALDQATGILQSITSDKLTDEIIRKVPTDEYIHMLHVMDDIISGSIKKEA